MPYEDIILELAIIEREAIARVEERLRALQLGEAWIDLVVEGGEPAED